MSSESVTKIANARLGISGLVLIGQDEPGAATRSVPGASDQRGG